MTITLRKLRRAGGEETPRFEAIVVHDGRDVATVSNGGTGGPCRFRWSADPAATLLAAVRLAAEQWPDLYARLSAAPSRDAAEDALGTVCMHEVEVMRLAKILDRAAKTKVLLRESGQPVGVYHTVSVPPTEHEITEVRRRYPTYTVLNSLPSRDRAERVMRAEP
jgi:hypothetical protein